MGPPLRTEIPKISPRRVRKTWGFTPAAAQLNAAVAHTVFGLMVTAMAVRPLGQPPRVNLSSAPARVPSWFASYLLDVDGFALVRRYPPTKSVGPLTIEMFRLCWLFYAIAKSSEATAGTAREQPVG